MGAKDGKKPKDEVDRAAAALDQAVSRLVGLLAHDDGATGEKAMRALLARGPEVAVGHLATALDRGVGDPRLLRRILFALVSIARDPRMIGPVLDTLALWMLREPNREILEMLVAASFPLILRLGVGPAPGVDEGARPRGPDEGPDDRQSGPR
jgi:hypothetical protein